MKKMIPLIDEGNEFYEKQKVCYICKKEFNTDENDKNDFNTNENDENEFNTYENDKFNTDEIDENALKVYDKVKDHCHYTGKFRGKDNICNLRYKTPKQNSSSIS